MEDPMNCIHGMVLFNLYHPWGQLFQVDQLADQKVLKEA